MAATTSRASPARELPLGTTIRWAPGSRRPRLGSTNFGSASLTAVGVTIVLIPFAFEKSAGRPEDLVARPHPSRA